MESTNASMEIFPEICKLMNILLTLPLGIATVEKSFSQMKLVILTYIASLITIVMESKLTKHQIVFISKEKNHKIILQCFVL